MEDLAIIVPCYNASGIIVRLAENLQSVVERAEIVFVDDGSSDDTGELIEEYFPRARLLRQENAGVASARNAGVRASQAPYLTLLDVDDSINIDFLGRRLDLLRSSPLDVVVAPWRMEVHSSQGVAIGPLEQTSRPADVVEALLGGSWWGPPHAYIFTREIYAAIEGGDPNLVNAQDFDLWIRMAIVGARFGFCSDPAGNYFRDERVVSLARGPRAQYWSDTETVVRRAAELLMERGAFTESRRRAAADRLHAIARNCVQSDRARYHRVMSQIMEWCPDFLPNGSGPRRWLSRTCGLRVADSVLAFTRALRWRRG